MCSKTVLLLAVTIFAVIGTSCVQNDQPTTANTSSPVPSTNVSTNTNTVSSETVGQTSPVTLPLIDAMFADEAFASELRSTIGLSDEQVQKVQQLARDAVLQLDESEEGSSTRASAERATDELKKAIGEDKTRHLLDLVEKRWAGGEQTGFLAGRPNDVPTDSRIVVNAPAYRMDVFRDGKLVKTYKIGIGYPEFPLPRGLRKAEKIIFNPTWTPPDEPWVKGKFEPYKKVEAGSKDNPLGLIKIPIGLPSLIHGGKNPAKLGAFASHGCVGLTNQQVEVFAQDLANLAGNRLTMNEVKAYQKDKSKTEELKLQTPVAVELRYETIVVEDGKVHIYRDVYELGTNTEENLRKVLSAYDVDLDDLDEATRMELLDGLRSMAVDAKGKPITEDDGPSKTPAKSKSGKITSTIKGKKEIVIGVSQLAGKGYPSAVNLMG